MASADDLAIRLSALLDAVLTAESVPKFVTALNQILVADGLTLIRRQMSSDGEIVECRLDEWAPANITIVDSDALKETVDMDGGIRVGGCSDGSDVILRPIEAGGGLSCSTAAGLVVRVLRLHRTLVGSIGEY